MGFFSKNVDGRIDDPNAGWKGRGLWTTFGSRTVFHGEGGKEARPRVFKVQMRPDPRAHEGPSAMMPLPQRRWRLARDHRQKTPETFSRT
jgi:hypothetical protein